MGCSTSEKPPPDSSPPTMNRTPMEPSEPAFPPAGPTIFAVPVCMERAFH